MPAMPAEVRRLVDSVAIERWSPAYLLVGKNGRLLRSGGHLDRYGIARLDRDRSVDSQLDYLVGLIPLDEGSTLLRQVALRAGQSVDVHLVAGRAGDWIVLLDTTREAAQQMMIQQVGNELALLQTRFARAAGASTNPPSSTDEVDRVLRAQLPSILDVLVLERTTKTSFRCVGTPPSWFADLRPDVLLEGAQLHLSACFVFLDSFLADAADIWRRPGMAALSSGIWTEIDRSGVEYALQARALYVSDHDILLIERVDSAYAEMRRVLQTGREAKLALIERERVAASLAETRDVLERRVAERTTELVHANERLRALSQRLLETQETERRSIARELHDEIGQLLTAVTLDLQFCLKLPGMTPAADHLHESIALVQRVCMRVRDLSLDLHPPLLDQMGLPAAVRWHVRREAERAGLVARVATDAFDSRLGSDIETACFRVVQEAVTNIVRHARAHSIGVELRHHEDGVVLTVRDDGAGFDLAAARQRAAHGRSLGLVGMEERVALAGGRLSIESAPGEGTVIRASFSEPRPPSTGAAALP